MNPQILAIILASVFLLVVIGLLRSYVLPEKYAVAWLVAAVVSLVFAIFPQLLNALSRFLGIADPTNLLFFASFFIVLLMLMQISLEMARTRDELRRALQQIALELAEARTQNRG